MTNLKFYGIDEVGKGAGFGPLVLCKALKPNDSIISELLSMGLYNSKKQLWRDSKALSQSKREFFYDYLNKRIDFMLLGYSNHDIDNLGIETCQSSGLFKFVQDKHSNYLIDGLHKSTYPNGSNIKYLPKADTLFIEVCIASIIAKVYRDNMIISLSKKYSNEYGLSKNKGYLTKQHINAIHLYGLTSLHRKSFIK